MLNSISAPILTVFVFQFSTKIFEVKYTLASMIFVMLRPFINLGVPQYFIANKFHARPRILKYNLILSTLLVILIYVFLYFIKFIDSSDFLFAPVFIAMSFSEHVLLKTQSRGEVFSLFHIFFPSIARLIILVTVIFFCSSFYFIGLLGSVLLIYAFYEITTTNIVNSDSDKRFVLNQYIVSNFGQFLLANSAFFVIKFKSDDITASDYFIYKTAVNMMLIPITIYFHKVVILRVQHLELREILTKISRLFGVRNIVLFSVVLALGSCIVIMAYALLAGIEGDFRIFGLLVLQVIILSLSSILGVLYTRIEYAKFRMKVYLSLGVSNLLVVLFLGNTLINVLLIELSFMCFLLIFYSIKYVRTNKSLVSRI